MDLDDRLLITRQAARIGELETWIALLVVLHGKKNGLGFKYSIDGQHASEARQELTGPIRAISFEYDARRDRHVIDVF
jgi:hypothetical protein